MANEDFEDGEFWVAEWRANGARLVFDPAAQNKAGTTTFFNVSSRTELNVLNHRTAAVVRRVEPSSADGELFRLYRQWRADQKQQESSAKKRRAKRAPHDRVPDGFQDGESIAVDEAALEADWKVFCSMFPEQFAGSRFVEEERNYKLEAGTRIREAFNQDVVATLSEDELTARLIRAAGATDNLLFSTEHAAFQGGLRAPGPHRARVLQALADLLWGESSAQERFSEWVDAVESLPLTGKTSPFKWPVVTALPFLARPEEHCILKPMNAQATAKRYRVHLRYRVGPNYETYARWLDLVDAIGARLQERGARDRLDVQSFLWRVERRNVEVTGNQSPIKA